MANVWIDGHLLAPLLLGLIGGFLVGRFLFLAARSRGCVLLFGGALTLFLVSALIRGRSPLLEILTYNLGRYIWSNPEGFLGLVMGLFLASVLSSRGRRARWGEGW